MAATNTASIMTHTLDVPIAVMKNRHNFVVEATMTGLKVVYTTVQSDCVRLHFLTLSRDITEPLLERDVTEPLLELADTWLTENREHSTVHVIGSPRTVDIRGIVTALEQKLHVQVVCQEDKLGPAVGFRFLLEHSELPSLFLPPYPDAREAARIYIQDTVRVMLTAEDGTPTTPLWQATARRNTSEESGGAAGSYLLVVLGQQSRAFVIEENGRSYDVGGIDGLGSFLCGFGCLLTGAKDMGELLGLIDRGEPRNVDVYSDSLFNKDTVDPALAKKPKWCHDSAIWAFGKVTGRTIDDFVPEDLGAALGRQVTDILTTTCFFTALKHGCSHLVIASDLLAQSDLLRQFTESQFYTNLYKVGEDYPLDFQIVKYGEYLGCLGSMVKS